MSEIGIASGLTGGLLSPGLLLAELAGFGAHDLAAYYLIGTGDALLARNDVFLPLELGEKQAGASLQGETMTGFLQTLGNPQLPKNGILGNWDSGCSSFRSTFWTDELSVDASFPLSKVRPRVARAASQTRPRCSWSRQRLCRQRSWV